MDEPKLEENKIISKGIIAKSLVIISILLLLAGWFYWFQWRPSNIRRSCVLFSFECAASYRDNQANNGDWAAQKQQKENTVSTDVRERCYETCLNAKGLIK